MNKRRAHACRESTIGKRDSWERDTRRLRNVRERIKEGLSVCMQGQNWKLLPLLIALNQRANILRLLPWYRRSSSVA
jgi:hypothetical protein